jgi:peroxiredoxin (alkyl hydroperoxide reductase subunit C)
MALQVGDEAPDFELKDQHGQLVRLSSFRGEKNVLVVFYPWAFSSVCGGELDAMQEHLTDFQNDDVAVLTVSTDSMYALRTFADAKQYAFPLLADFWPHGEVAKAYGVFNDIAGMANRGTFLIDKDGVVRFAEMNAPGEARDQGGWQKAIDALAA